jgi:hypothetical protein
MIKLRISTSASFWNIPEVLGLLKEQDYVFTTQQHNADILGELLERVGGGPQLIVLTAGNALSNGAWKGIVKTLEEFKPRPLDVEEAEVTTFSDLMRLKEEFDEYAVDLKQLTKERCENRDNIIKDINDAVHAQYWRESEAYWAAKNHEARAGRA